MRISERDKPSWLLTIAYVSPREELKTIFWERMRRIAEDTNEAWIIMGDLNDILETHEKKGGARNLETHEKKGY